MSIFCGDGLLLELREESPSDPSREWLQSYRFDILLKGKNEKVGSIDFRVGYTTSVVRYGGHIGYSVDIEHRGKRYAARACKLLLPLAKKHGMDVIWITCNPDNYASRRTCEIMGAELIEVLDIPPDNDQYHKGERKKCRYRLIVY